MTPGGAGRQVRMRMSASTGVQIAAHPRHVGLILGRFSPGLTGGGIREERAPVGCPPWIAMG
eukprot:17839-Heterocapsa_arctica.AAC.1